MDAPIGHVDAVERAICSETCAYRGEPPCWQFEGSWPNKNCDEPGCHALACVAVIATRQYERDCWRKIAEEDEREERLNNGRFGVGA